jgi:chlorobactene glucosyltransferase
VDSSNDVEFLEGLSILAGIAFVVRGLNVALRSTERLESREPDEQMPFLSIIVPARNEERQIEHCLRSLLAQRYPSFEVIAVDDRSTDSTSEILENIAMNHARLRVVRGKPLPEGWIGKPWALAQGANAARGAWLLFTDADTVHEPLAAASAVNYALQSQTSVLSLLTGQRFETPAERIVLPTILWMIAFAVGSLEAINDPKRIDAAIFNGQFVLFEREAYNALGGHATVHDCIAEDYEFARIIKRDGRFRSRLVGAAQLVSTRMYRSFPEIWNGFSKNLYIAARDAPGRALAGIVTLGALSPLPEYLLSQAIVKRRYRKALRMASVIAATAAAAEAGMRRSRFPRGSGAFFPVGAATMLAIFLNSARLHRTGRVTWRGRTYPRRTA